MLGTQPTVATPEFKEGHLPCFWVYLWEGVVVGADLKVCQESLKTKAGVLRAAEQKLGDCIFGGISESLDQAALNPPPFTLPLW